MKKYCSIIKSYFRYSVMLEMEYKFNFFFGGIFELIWLVMYLALVEVIFLGASDIGGWSKYQVLLLTFQNGLIDALITLTAVPGLSQIPELVNTGKLDFILLKPVNTRFHLSFRSFSLSQIRNVIINSGGIVFCAVKLNLSLTPKTVIFYVILTLAGLLIIYNILFMMMLLSFWILRMGFVWGFCTELNTIGNKPYSIYPKLIQTVLTYGLPLLIAFHYPVLALLGREPYKLLIIALLTAAIWFGITNIILQRGLKKYVSTGS